MDSAAHGVFVPSLSCSILCAPMLCLFLSVSNLLTVIIFVLVELFCPLPYLNAAILET